MTIELNRLSYRYAKSPHEALGGLTATIEPGMHLLLGENGAGKTTLLHLIAGLRYPTTGTCRIDGGETRLRLPSLLSRLFFLGASTSLPARSIDELARIHGRFYPRFSAERLRDNLGRFGLTGSEPLKSLSMGSRQKAAVSYALALQTDILLLDEPATGLDIESKLELQRMLAASIEPEQTVIVSTHNIADLERLFDGVIILRGGRLMLAATVDEVTERVAFVTTPSAPADALYCEPGLGCFRSIRACAAGEEPMGDIDYRLLYTALHQPDPSSLQQALTKQ